MARLSENAHLKLALYEENWCTVKATCDLPQNSVGRRQHVAGPSSKKGVGHVFPRQRSAPASAAGGFRRRLGVRLGGWATVAPGEILLEPIPFAQQPDLWTASGKLSRVQLRRRYAGREEVVEGGHEVARAKEGAPLVCAGVVVRGGPATSTCSIRSCAQEGPTHSPNLKKTKTRTRRRRGRRRRRRGRERGRGRDHDASTKPTKTHDAHVSIQFLPPSLSPPCHDLPPTSHTARAGLRSLLAELRPNRAWAPSELIGSLGLDSLGGSEGRTSEKGGGVWGGRFRDFKSDSLFADHCCP